MTISTAQVSEINDAVEGAVIDHLEAGIQGLHLVLRDGRIIMFPDALICAVIATPEILH